MSVSYVKIFNQLTDEFFRELLEMYPQETKIKVKYNLFQTICATNAKKPCNDFMIGSIPYVERISVRDEQLMTSDDIPDFVKQMNLNKLWPTMTPKTKNAIWNYIKNMFIMGNNVVKMPDETLPYINYIINYK